MRTHDETLRALANILAIVVVIITNIDNLDEEQRDLIFDTMNDLHNLAE